MYQNYYMQEEIFLSKTAATRWFAVYVLHMEHTGEHGALNSTSLNKASLHKHTNAQ
jgi:hypothetical protein